MEIPVLHLFCGIGGGSLGFQQAAYEYKGIKGRFRNLAGIDCDPNICSDYERITGSKAVVMDLFDKKQYTAFWGNEPPESWHEAMPQDLVDACGGEYPEVVFLSPPCKGFSGLLPEKSSKSEKYQALNRLVVRSMFLTMEAFRSNPPAAILIENVPRITSRGEHLLREVKQLLAQYGYIFHQSTHDCGELAGLGQTRKRFLLIARHKDKVPSFIYQPPKHPLKTIGDILGPLPMPGDTEKCGDMHRLPNLSWKTWERLALIPAGKDWRALNDLAHTPRGGAWKIVPFDEPSPTITGSMGPGRSNGISAIADPRLDYEAYSHAFKVGAWEKPSSAVTSAHGYCGGMVADPRLETVQGYGSKYAVTDFDSAAPVVTGSRVGSGAVLVSDPRPTEKERWDGCYKVVDWADSAPTVTGQSGLPKSNSGISIADPRLSARPGRYPGLYRVVKFDETAPTVIGQTDIQTGALTVADPRAGDHPTWRRTSVTKVTPWDEPSGVVMGSSNLHGAGSGIVADPRLNCTPRSGTMGVMEWDQPAKTVIGSGDIHAGAAAVADPRMPEPDDRGVYMIISEDNTWHRPITTFEMAILQGLPATFPDGSPLVLCGKSDKAWRERIGNMVPPPTATAIAQAMLETLMPNLMGDWHWGTSDQVIWVVPDGEKREKVQA